MRLSGLAWWRSLLWPSSPLYRYDTPEQRGMHPGYGEEEEYRTPFILENTVQLVDDHPASESENEEVVTEVNS